MRGKKGPLFVLYARECHVIWQFMGVRENNFRAFVITPEFGKWTVFLPSCEKEDHVHVSFSYCGFPQVDKVYLRNADTGFLKELACRGFPKGFTAGDESARKTQFAYLRGNRATHEHDAQSDKHNQYGNGFW